MADALYFYLPLTVDQLKEQVESHQEEFDEYLNDLFSEDELASFEKQLDSMAAIFAQPLISEMTFDDFYADESVSDLQRSFFDTCRSCICLENLPDFHFNPFQVTYLLQLLNRFSEALIDKGGVEELTFKGPFLEELRGHKSVDALIGSVFEKPIEVKPIKAIFPIDFLIQDVYREFDRLRDLHRIYHAMEQVESLPEKSQKIFKVMMNEKLDSDSLLRKSGLIPKDFGDNMERLKFFLKKL